MATKKKKSISKLSRTEKQKRLAAAANALATEVEKNGIRKFGKGSAFNAQYENDDRLSGAIAGFAPNCAFGHVVAKAGLTPKKETPTSLVGNDETLATVLNLIGGDGYIDYSYIPESLNDTLEAIAHANDSGSRKRKAVAGALRAFAKAIRTTKITTTK